MNLFDLPETAAAAPSARMCAACGNQPTSSPRTNTCAACETGGYRPQSLLDGLDAPTPEPPRSRCSGCPWNAEHADACPGYRGLACGYQAPAPPPLDPEPADEPADEEDQDHAPPPRMRDADPAELSRVERLALYGTANVDHCRAQRDPDPEPLTREPCDCPDSWHETRVLHAAVADVLAGTTDHAKCCANRLPAQLCDDLTAWMRYESNALDAVTVVGWIGRGDRIADALRAHGNDYGARCAAGVETLADTIAEAVERQEPAYT